MSEDFDPYDEDYFRDMQLLGDEDNLDDCGMMPNGQCLQAGSEWCDWDCPRNRMDAPA